MPRTRRRILSYFGCWLALAALMATLFVVTPFSADRPAHAADNEAGGRTELSITVPPYHGLEPNLSLIYSAGGRNDWIGVGWSLTGLSQIQRVGPNKGTPAYDSRDRFLLDGLDLVPCTTASDSPGCQHPSSPSATPYATRIEHFQRIEFTPNVVLGGAWTVWSTNGVKRTYAPRLAVDWPGGPPQLPFSWHLESVADPLGNRVSYDYAADADPRGIGQEYLRSIQYNGTLINFETAPRPDVVTTAAGPGVLVTRKRLARVDVLTGGDLVRTYRLGYQLVDSVGSGRSLLREVRQFSRDAQLGPNGQVTGGTAAPPVTMGTTAPDAPPIGSFTAETGEDIVWGPPWPDNGFARSRNWDNVSPARAYTRVNSQRCLPGDFDGDARTDYFCVTLDGRDPFTLNLRVAMPTHDGTPVIPLNGSGEDNYRYVDFQQTDIFWPGDFPPAEPFFQPLIGDVNGDGLSDAVIVRREADDDSKVWAHTFLSLGNGRFERTTPARLGIVWDDRVRLFLGDTSGDGRSDLITAICVAPGRYRLRRLS